MFLEVRLKRSEGNDPYGKPLHPPQTGRNPGRDFTARQHACFIARSRHRSIGSFSTNEAGIGGPSLVTGNAFLLLVFISNRTIVRKYIGYKEFSAWTASDSDFFSVRRFDRLHTRAILTLQAQLVDIEERIDTLDKHYSSRNVKLSNAKPPSIVTVSEPLDDFEKLEFRDINNGTVNDDLPERAKLVAEMTSKLVEYGA